MTAETQDTALDEIIPELDDEARAILDSTNREALFRVFAHLIKERNQQANQVAPDVERADSPSPKNADVRR